MASVGIQAMEDTDRNEIMHAVRTFNTFSAGDDPYGEHDFGAFTHKGERVIFKIDYFDKKLECGSEDPADPAQTVRVMTIMLSQEY